MHSGSWCTVGVAHYQQHAARNRLRDPGHLMGEGQGITCPSLRSGAWRTVGVQHSSTAVTQDRQTHKPLRSIPGFEFEMFLLGPSDLILSCVCARGRVRVIAASAPPQRSTDNRHWADVRFAECWSLSARDRDGDAAGAPRVRWPGPHGGHRWGAEPCRTFIHTAPENLA